MSTQYALRIITLFGLIGCGMAQAQEADGSGDQDAELSADNLSDDVEVELPQPQIPVLTEWPIEVTSALESWQESWEEKPELVSLRDDGGAILETAEAVHTRLKLLGTKVLSNREWSEYWSTQTKDAEALAKALEDASLSPERVKGLRDWAALADRKIINQRAYLDAILFERDTQEARLETMLDAEDTKEDVDTASDDPNPYEQRALKLAELERQIQSQTQKKTKAQNRIQYIEQQLLGEEKLVLAMETDELLALAEAQLSLGQAQLNLSDPLQSLWETIAQSTEDKASKIASEASHYKKRARTRQVELELTSSEMDYRDRRIAEVQLALDNASGFDTLIAAVWDTFKAWLTEQAWRIIIALFIIWLGIRFTLRMIQKGATLILTRADDDPDKEDAGDQRRQTLADVFVGLARIAVYIVGGLVALEQIGINTGPILGSVAILGLAISFGSQNLVRDVVNGFFILLENQYAVGDVVQLNGQTGTVEKLTIRSTWIREYNGNIHAIPNGTINMVSNMTRDWSRAVCHIGVAYDSDLAEVQRVVESVSQEILQDPDWSDTIQDGPDFVGVTELAASSVMVRIVAKTKAGSHWGLTREMNRRFKEAFADAGIEIPFPQQVVRHVNAAD